MLVSFSSALLCPRRLTTLPSQPFWERQFHIQHRGYCRGYFYSFRHVLIEARITQCRLPWVRYTANHYKAVLDGAFLSILSPLALR